ncbi:MAG: ACP S-malonyltransferase [Candidatus Margulisbacteria bacterium]|nr:ACP S-malonyltransferase [Candidatus Margulisiibacteriota bacterium]
MIIFPGQGSQKLGMGDALFERYKNLIEKADDILGYSIKSLCLEGPVEKLNDTVYTQPALFVVNALTYLTMREDDGMVPDFIAGHSLGEFNALLAAKVFDFETGLKIVQKRGQLMGDITGGGMAAIIGLTLERVKDVVSEKHLLSIDIANINSPQQIVLSGPKKDIIDAEPLFKEAGAKLYIPLKVSGAFHSRYMKEAQEAFLSYISQFSFEAPKVTVYANVSAIPYTKETAIENISNQLTGPVKWVEIIETLATQADPEFIEVGPGRVLTGLIKKILT